MLLDESDEYFMREALRQARKAHEAEEVPIGAVVVREGKIIARAWNQVEMLKDATAHAEMLAITQAEAAVGDWRLIDCDLYVTKEPCPMCAGALVHVRMRRVIFGCADERGGAAGGIMNLLQMPGLNHRCEITRGVLEQECVVALAKFFSRATCGRKLTASLGFEPRQRDPESLVLPLHYEASAAELIAAGSVRQVAAKVGYFRVNQTSAPSRPASTSRGYPLSTTSNRARSSISSIFASS